MLSNNAGNGETRRWTRAQWGMLILFMAVHTMLGVDRAILSVLAEPIKSEFALTDTQLGILIGVGFAAFYSVAGFFVGWLVDRYDRALILASCVSVFGASTAAAAAAGSFIHLLGSRLLVGAGEAGGGPAMISLIADRFSHARIGLAMSIFYAGAPAGLLLTFLVGSQIAAIWGWRVAFLSAGLPAVLLGLLVLFTIRDDRVAVAGVPSPLPARVAARQLMGQRSPVLILIATAFATGAVSPLIAFSSSFLIRCHGLSLSQAGLLLAMSMGVAGVIGAPLSGLISDALVHRRPLWRVWWVAMALAIAGGLASVLLLVRSTPLAIAALVGWGLLSNAFGGPAMAAFHMVVARHARGIGTAAYYFAGILIGGAGGTLAVGVLSDQLSASHGLDAIRYALLLTVLFYAIASSVWMFAASSFQRDADKFR